MYEEIVSKINNSGYSGQIITVGGGSGVFSILSCNGGSSKFLLQGTIFNSRELLSEFVGYTPKHFCDSGLTYDLSFRIYIKSQHCTNNYNVPNCKIFGLAVNCSLYTGPTERIGRENKFYISYISPKTSLLIKGDFFKYMKRREQEEVVSHVILNTLCNEFDIEESIPLPDSVHIHLLSRTTFNVNS